MPKSFTVRAAIALCVVAVLGGGLFAVRAAAADKQAGKETGIFKTRRKGEFVLREGRLVGVQIEALDATVRPDGSTLPGFPLPIGTDFFLVEDFFLPDAATPDAPTGARIGTGRTDCTVKPPQGLVISCDITFELDGRGTFYGIETIDFRGITPGSPLRADVAVIGGTRQLSGVTGECALADRADHDVSGVSFYDCRLVQPAVARA